MHAPIDMAKELIKVSSGCVLVVGRTTMIISVFCAMQRNALPCKYFCGLPFANALCATLQLPKC